MQDRLTVSIGSSKALVIRLLRVYAAGALGDLPFAVAARPGAARAAEVGATLHREVFS